MTEFRCECGSTSFHEVGAVCTTTGVNLEADDAGSPVFIDYRETGSETIWDASSSYYIECSSCLARIDARGFENSEPDDETVSAIHALLDGKEWSPDTLDAIAGLVRAAGREVRSPDEPSVRLDYLRAELRAERISMSELAELQGLAKHIKPGDVELLEAAGVPEFEGEEDDDAQQ